MAMNINGDKAQRSIGVLLLMFGLGFFYKMAEILQKVQTWEILWNPPTVGDMLMAMCFGLGGVALGLGLDVPALLKGMGINLFQGSKE